MRRYRLNGRHQQWDQMVRRVMYWAFTLMGAMYDYYRTGHHLVCAWRPGRYTTSGVLSEWGYRQTSMSLSNRKYTKWLHPKFQLMCQGHFLLIGQATTSLEIDDLRHDTLQLGPIHAIMITPEWVQSLNQADEFRTGQTIVVSGAIGDVCDPRW